MGVCLGCVGWRSHFTAVRVKDLHATASATHGIRGEASFTWEENRRDVVASGHRWCALVRDNWACVGTRYRSTLSKTPPYSASAFSLASLPHGRRILADGDSFMAQKLLSIVCESDRGGNANASTWKVSNPYSSGGDNSNSVLWHNARADILVLVIDNDWYYQRNASLPLIGTLRRVQFQPHLIVLGRTWAIRNAQKQQAQVSVACTPSHTRARSLALPICVHAAVRLRPAGAGSGGPQAHANRTPLLHAPPRHTPPFLAPNIHRRMLAPSAYTKHTPSPVRRCHAHALSLCFLPCLPCLPFATLRSWQPVCDCAGRAQVRRQLSWGAHRFVVSS